MKKILFTLIFICTSFIQISAINYGKGSFLDVSCSLNTSYIYRGERLGGLSVQPEINWGYQDTYQNAIVIGAWGSIGDCWCEDCNQCCTPFDEPYFEVDIFIEYRHGETFKIGLNHIYYFDGSPYFDFINDRIEKDGPQTEVYAELCIFESFPLTIFWGTIIAGQDCGDWWFKTKESDCRDRPYSSYLEVSYPIEFGYSGWTLTPIVGMSPWKGYYTYVNDYNIKDFSFNNIQLNVTKEWEIGNSGYVDLYADLVFNLSDPKQFNYNQDWMWNIGITVGL